jgi:hypothetical protein
MGSLTKINLSAAYRNRFKMRDSFHASPESAVICDRSQEVSATLALNAFFAPNTSSGIDCTALPFFMVRRDSDLSASRIDTTYPTDLVDHSWVWVCGPARSTRHPLGWPITSTLSPKALFRCAPQEHPMVNTDECNPLKLGVIHLRDRIRLDLLAHRSPGTAIPIRSSMSVQHRRTTH